jgi:hypothetical protein
MDALLKGCAFLLLCLIALIAVAPVTHVATTRSAPSTVQPPAMPNVMATTCPLSSVEALIDAKQLTPVNTGRSSRCMEIGVADSLWRSMDLKDRHGLVLAVECAVSADQRIPCLKLYSQTSGALFGSAEMGRVTVER